MFDIGAAELLVIVIVAILVIGPKEMPRAMRTAGRWIGQVRKVSAHFRTGIDAMVREAELEDMEKKWKAQNEEIMKRTAITAENGADTPVMTGPPPLSTDDGPDPEADDPAPKVSAESRQPKADDAAPELPLAPREDSATVSKKSAG
ncbi:Sec-independent protein translocase protein TatB [Erythrobacter ani]|uniref:Sec-independent protein translocase protein TatB n=1 Tax=Erythrobacter ani TaxID=2827235 RepID=A0ABS6SIQ7_9SPHN|nr:Sec-independent protein translocase protein TatB [Erythrobacter ani]MBV7264896.1 twin-arginine translocase subunit TatB [Erythrobacter ani]